MAPTNDISQMELVNVAGDLHRTAEEADVEPEETASLPPVDGGRAAWLFLAGSFFIEMLLWGMKLCLISETTS